MTKNSHSDFKSQFSISTILSIIIHVILFSLIYYSVTEDDLKKDSENFEIIDADIIGLVNQSKSEKNQIKETSIVASKSEDLAHDVENEDKKEVIKEEKKEEVKKIPEDVEEKKEVVEKEETKKIEEQKLEKDLVKEEEKRIEDVKKDEISHVKEEIKEERVIEEQKKIEEKKVEVKENQITKEESKKINDAIKKIEEKERAVQKEKKELDDLKKSLNKANKVLNNIDNPNQNIKNKNTQANNLVGGGDEAMAKLGSYIKSRIIGCWKIPPMIGVENENISVNIKIFLDKDGSVLRHIVLNKRSSGNQRFFDIILDSAVNAINTCSPITNLPEDRYDEWKEVNLNFDPSKFM
jgi:TolA protein